MKTLARVMALAVVASLIALLGVPAANAFSGDNNHGRTYKVTVTNVTDSQILTPVTFAAHNQRADLFDLGRPASPEPQQLAENGNLMPLVEALPGIRDVRTSGIGAGAEGPLAPGATRQFELSAPRNARLISTVQMIVCSNDGFTGLDSLQLPTRKWETVKVYAYAWDAGTEKNTGDLNDLVPPCSPEGIGTGATDSTLSEDGVIAPHRGLTGEAGEMFSFDADGPIAVYEITRTR
jgi:hypothetical protein